MKWLLSSITVLALGIGTTAQTLAQTEEAQALLRLERLQVGEDACVLVEQSGDYRLEKLFRAKAEMYKGVLDSAQLSQLRTLLASDSLRKLSQEEIHGPLISNTLETIQLAIWRDRGWQELRFASPESRKPFRESLDPLLRWFQQLQKERPMASQVDGAATRCMPTPAAQIAVSNEKSNENNAAQMSGPPPYLFRLHSTHFNNGQADSTCTIVYGDGKYHSEHSYQSLNADRQGKIAEGQVDAAAIRDLRTILDSSDLSSIPGGSSLGDVGFAREAEMTDLSIPREGKIQLLVFSDWFNTLGNRTEVGGLSNMNYRITDEKMLKPLHEWIKRYPDHSHLSEKKGTGNECAPVRSAGPANADLQ
jgi:hypothetical protein